MTDAASNWNIRQIIDSWVARGWAYWVDRTAGEWRVTKQANRQVIATTLERYTTVIAQQAAKSNLEQL